MLPFFAWHYTQGLKLFFRRWRYSFDWILHQFSPTLLLKTLFAPWKRMIDTEPMVGLNLQRLFEKIMDQIISRGVGAAVRIFLFISSLLALLITSLVGGGVLLIWIICPIISIFSYFNFQKKSQFESLVAQTIADIKNNPSEAPRLIFSANEAGAYILRHAGLEVTEIAKTFFPNETSLTKLTATTYPEIVAWFIDCSPKLEEALRPKLAQPKDLVAAATWWEESLSRRQKAESEKEIFGRPSLALSLIFGYTPNLDKYVTDLGAPQSFSHHLIGREEIVKRIERNLQNDRGVLVTGQPGVGKHTVVLEFARRAASGLLGKSMSYKRVLELDVNSLLSLASDINQKKTTLAQILAEAAHAGNIILVIKDIQRLTHPDVEGFDFTDIFEKHLSIGELKIIAIASQSDYERFISQNGRLRKYLEVVEVTPPPKEEALRILRFAAEEWERRQKITLSTPVLRAILEGSDRYISETPFPEKALELLDGVILYKEQHGGGNPTVEDVNSVLSEKTGISFAHISTAEKEKLGNLEEIIHQNLINQEAAVSLIAKSLRARTLGVKNEDKPIGTFLFLGPTGVGKTQTAKTLAQVYFGSEENMLRFDMAEYQGAEGLERLIGSVARNQPGALTTTIKNRPASLLLLDEIEKAPKEIYSLFLSLIDEGVIHDAFGRSVNAKHLFVIATSNAGANFIREKVTEGVRGEILQKVTLDYVQQQGIFSPEFLNRFDGVVVFEPLTKENLVKIAHLELTKLSEKIKKQGIELTFTEETCQKVAEDGYDPVYGARPMRRVIDLTIGDLIGRGILEGRIKAGNRILLLPQTGGEEAYHTVTDTG